MSKAKTTVATIAKSLSQALSPLSFGEPVAYVYDPLTYAWAPHADYLNKYGTKKKRVLLLGMNPGPFGMAQTGVPFGEVALARDFLGVKGKVGKPPKEHPKRPVLGFECARSEVSGARLWGWAKARYGTAESFFDSYFVANYCPLVFMNEKGANVIPEKLTKEERTTLFQHCDEALRETVKVLEPSMLLGVGKFAEKCLKRVCPEFEGPIGSILHPSPASPMANRGWAPQAEKQLEALGVELPAKVEAVDAH